MVRVWKTPQGCAHDQWTATHRAGMSYNSTENLGGQKSLDILGCKEQGCPGNDECETGNDSVAITKSLRYIAIDQQAD